MLDHAANNVTAQGYPAGSYYAATATPLAPFPALAGDTVADVAVVGGGYAGLSAALHLAKRGYDVVLLEAERVGWGASGRNGGQMHSGQRRGQATLEASVGPDDARKLWDLALEAMALVRGLIAEHDIDCDLRDGLIHAAHKASYVDDYRAEVDHMRARYGYEEIDFLSKEELAEKVGCQHYFGGTLDRGGGHLHPLKFALGLARAASDAGVRIHEGSPVTALEQGGEVTLKTPAGSVRAKFAVVCGNGYLHGLLPQVEARVLPINNFIAATTPLDEATADSVIRDREAVADSRFVVNYYRLSADNRLLFGGGENYSARFPADIASFVRPHMEATFPHLKGVAIDHAWGGTLAITMQRMPYLTRIGSNIFAACGFSGQGVVIAPFAGQLVAEAIDGQAARFDIYSRLKTPAFPGGTWLRHPIMVLAMLWYALRDRL